MSKSLVYFDLEATGTDPYTDRVVEIAMIRFDDGERSDPFHTLVNPVIPIPEGATAVHGIAAEDVADAPRFAEVAEVVQAMVSNAVLVGYYSRRYDVPLIHTELRRAGKAGLPTDGHGAIAAPEIDLHEVWRQAEPRTLVSAAARFAGRDIEAEAHAALTDVAILPHVLRGIADQFDLAGYDESYPDGRGGVDPYATLTRLQEISVPEWAVDRSGKFRKEDGRIVFDFGKHKGEPAASRPKYLQWMISADFPPDTKAVCRRILNGGG